MQFKPRGKTVNYVTWLTSGNPRLEVPIEARRDGRSSATARHEEPNNLISSGYLVAIE